MTMVISKTMMDATHIAKPRQISRATSRTAPRCQSVDTANRSKYHTLR